MKIRTILLAGALSAGALLAQPGPGPRGPHGPANLDALKQVLELTDQQVTDLQTARKTYFENELRPIMEQIREKRQALRTEMQQENPNAALVGQLQVDIANLAKQARDKRAAETEQLRATLTDAQKAKLAQLEAAAKLLPAVHEAGRLGLLDFPEDAGAGPGPDRFGPFGRRGPRGGGPAFR